MQTIGLEKEKQERKIFCVPSPYQGEGVPLSGTDEVGFAM